MRRKLARKLRGAFAISCEIAPIEQGNAGATDMPVISTIPNQVTGFDVKGAVDQLLGVEKLRIDQLNSHKDAEQAKVSALNDLASKLSAFRQVAQGLSDASGIFAYAATLSSSNANVPAGSLLEVSGTNAVSAGNHSIVVNQVAQAERLSSSAAVTTAGGAAVTDPNAALGFAASSFQINGATINVKSTDSLQDIAFSINQANQGASATGVTASVVKVGASDYRLVLTADATGSAGFTLSGAALDAGGALAGLNLGATGQTNARQTLQAAQDAQVTIDGLLITRSSNSISDALPGVTLNLKQADPATTITMSIDVDRQALRDNVQSFVDAYNAVQDFINQQFVFDEKTQKNGVLASEPLLTSIQQSLSSSILASVPGLAADRDSLVRIGVEPDKTGRLQINDNLFDNFLNNDVNAIRDVFAARGSSVDSHLQFLVAGLNTPSGTYAVNVTQPATKSSATAAALPTAADTVTIVQNGRQAVVNLTGAQTQAQVVDAFNAEFAAVRTEQHRMSAALTDSATGQPATGATTLAALGLGVAAGDTITISGTNRTGATVSGTFTVLDPATDTLSSLLSAIQSAFDQQVVASMDATGHVVVTDASSGDSQLAVTLTANNEGGGTLNFGTDTIVTEGRYAMDLVASASGAGVRIESRQYGAGSTFSLTESLATPAFGAVVPGQDVAGTIGGQPANGSGQMLTGAGGNVDGLSVLFTGSAATTADLVVSMGAGARLDGAIDVFTNPVTGLIQNAIAASQDTTKTIDQQIADLQFQMDQKRTHLTQMFTRLAQSLSQLKSTQTFITNQVNAANKTTN